MLPGVAPETRQKSDAERELEDTAIDQDARTERDAPDNEKNAQHSFSASGEIVGPA